MQCRHLFGVVCHVRFHHDRVRCVFQRDADGLANIDVWAVAACASPAAAPFVFVSPRAHPRPTLELFAPRAGQRVVHVRNGNVPLVRIITRGARLLMCCSSVVYPVLVVVPLLYLLLLFLFPGPWLLAVVIAPVWRLVPSSHAVLLCACFRPVITYFPPGDCVTVVSHSMRLVHSLSQRVERRWRWHMLKRRLGVVAPTGWRDIPHIDATFTHRCASRWTRR